MRHGNWWLKRRPQGVLVVVVSLILVLIGGVDSVSSTELSFALFYLLPVIVAGWFAGRRAGFFMAAASALVWLAADLRGGALYSSTWVAYVNAALRSVAFLVVAGFVVTVRRLAETLQQNVVTRTAELADEIDERKRVQDSLRESDSRFRQLAENVREVFWLTDAARTQVLYVSPAYEIVWARTCASLYKSPQDWLSAVHPEDRERVESAAKTRQTRGDYHEEYRIVRPDGTLRWVRDRAFPVRDTTGEVYRIAGITEDITAHKRTERTLQRHSLILASMMEGVILSDETGNIFYTNAAAEAMFSYSAGELIGRHVSVLNHYAPKENDRVVTGIIEQLKTRGHWSGELQNRRKDGTAFVTSARMTSLAMEGEHYFVSVQEDITERKRSEAALKEKDQRLRAVVDRVPIVLFAVNKDQVITSEEGRGLQDLHIRPGENVGRRVSDIYGHVPAILDNVQRGLNGEVFTSTFEDRGLAFDCWYAPEKDEQGNIVGMVGVGANITERRRLERQVLEISDREKARVGNDLHDGLCQELVGLAFAANSLEQKLAARGVAEAAEVRQVGLTLDNAITQARNIARGLSPVQLEIEGLAAALQELAAATGVRHDIDCKLEYPSPVFVPDNAIATHLYWIAQEAVNNAIKHSGAARVTIRLTQSSDRIELVVLDDGIGIRQQPPYNHGMGLNIMQYRARTIGGAFEIRQCPDGGTQIACSIPK